MAVEIRIIKILVVDQDHEFVNTLMRHLKREGFSLDCAASYWEAYNKIKASYLSDVPFHLLITEVFEPKRESLLFIKRMTREFPDTSILIVSGFGEEDEVSTILRSIDQYCPKAITPQEMLARIKHINDMRKICLSSGAQAIEHGAVSNRKGR